MLSALKFSLRPRGVNALKVRPFSTSAVVKQGTVVDCYTPIPISEAEQWAHDNKDYRGLSVIEDVGRFTMPGEPYVGMGPSYLPPNGIHEDGRTRLYIFPEKFFKLLEPRLGFSGGYSFIFGALALMIQKEAFVVCSSQALSMTIVMGCGVHLFGRYFAPWNDSMEKAEIELKHEMVENWKQHKLSLVESEIDGVEKLKEQASGLPMIQEQRKNNITSSIEAEYMNRQADLVAAVKKNLDYHVTLKNAERDAMQKHMINWIENEVNESISQQDPQADLDAAIGQLKAMA